MPTIKPLPEGIRWEDRKPQPFSASWTKKGKKQ